MIPATLSLIKLLSFNRIDSTCNEYTELLSQFPEVTRPTTKSETVKTCKEHSGLEIFLQIHMTRTQIPRMTVAFNVS